MGKHDDLYKAAALLPAIGDKGALLVSGTDKPNVMTIGWAMTSVMWFKNLFIAPVRKSRHTHCLLETHGEFTVFVPSGDMNQVLGICGTISGRDTDKAATCGLDLVPSTVVQVPRINAPGTVVECRVIYKTDFDNDALDDAVRMRYYSGDDTGNMHTLYFGEILAVHEQP